MFTPSFSTFLKHPVPLAPATLLYAMPRKLCAPTKIYLLVAGLRSSVGGQQNPQLAVGQPALLFG
jgi:hypothetical protein